MVKCIISMCLSICPCIRIDHWFGAGFQAEDREDGGPACRIQEIVEFRSLSRIIIVALTYEHEHDRSLRYGNILILSNDAQAQRRKSMKIIQLSWQWNQSLYFTLSYYSSSLISSLNGCLICEPIFEETIFQHQGDPVCAILFLAFWNLIYMIEIRIEDQGLFTSRKQQSGDYHITTLQT